VVALRNPDECFLGGSVTEACVSAFYLEKIGRNYLEAKSTGAELVLPSFDLHKESRDPVMENFCPGVLERVPQEEEHAVRCENHGEAPRRDDYDAKQFRPVNSTVQSEVAAYMSKPPLISF